MKRKILIADDEPSIVTAVEFLLRREGFDVEIARDGAEALERIQSSRPDLVVLDVMMPQKSGYEVCRSIRERDDWRDIKIVMLSAKGRDTEVAKGMGLGADAYITKPFSTRDLMARVKSLLEPGA